MIAEHRPPLAGGLGANPSGGSHECWEATFVDKLIPGRTPILGLVVGEIWGEIPRVCLPPALSDSQEEPSQVLYAGRL